MSRREARKSAFILIFQIPFHKGEPLHDRLPDFVEELEDPSEEETKFIQKHYDSLIDNLSSIDALIENYAVSWSIERLSKVDLAILRLAINEILFFDDIPESVTVNEAVEIAKMYSSDEAPAFINGILGKYLKEKES